MKLLLSLFPGIDLLGMAFEAEGFTVVRGPDTLWGGDIRRFTAPRGVFEGIIAGSPCQDFSKARRTPPSGEGMELLGHFHRCVTEARPHWFVLENVPGVPPVRIEGYTVQRIHIRASELGGSAHRLRIIQFGHAKHLYGWPLVIPRTCDVPAATEPAALATEGRRANRRGWAEFCAAQGLEQPLHLPGLTLEARYRAVGNGVHMAVGRAVAMAVKAWHVTGRQEACACECGRPVTYPRLYATVACRKRAQRKRDAAGGAYPRAVTCDPAGVSAPSSVTSGGTQMDIEDAIRQAYP